MAVTNFISGLVQDLGVAWQAGTMKCAGPLGAIEQREGMLSNIEIEIKLPRMGAEPYGINFSLALVV